MKQIKVNCKIEKQSVVIDFSALIIENRDKLMGEFNITILDTYNTSVFEKQYHNTSTLLLTIKDNLLKQGYPYLLSITSKEGIVISERFIAPLVSVDDVMWIKGKGISDKYYEDTPNTVFRRSIKVNDKVAFATYQGIGLGFYTLKINGKQVNASGINTAWTNYNKVVYYDQFDISSYLKQGDNEVLIELGNGWYHPAPLKIFGKYNLQDYLKIGEPQFMCEIVLKTDQEVVIIKSDNTWELLEGNYLFNNVYLGERLKIKREMRVLEENPIVMNNKFNVQPKFSPDVKKQERFEVVKFHEKGSSVIAEFPKIITGSIIVVFKSKPFKKIEMIYSEEINEDKSLNTRSTWAGTVGPIIQEYRIDGGEGAPLVAEQTNTVWLNEEGYGEYESVFTYHSFKYVEFKNTQLNEISKLEAVIIAANQETDGEIFTSNARMNALMELVKHTKINNTQSVFEDCARERFGYGGDMANLFGTQIMFFESRNLVRKTLMDFRNDMNNEGGLPETAPFMGIKSFGTGNNAGPLGWQSVYPKGILSLLNYYNDKDFVRGEMEYMRKHMTFLMNLDLDVVKDFCLGDWGSYDSIVENHRRVSPAKEFCAYTMLLSSLNTYSDIVEFIDEDKELLHIIHQKVSELKAYIDNKFLNPDGTYADRTQTSFAYALHSNIKTEQEFIQKFISKIETTDQDITTGIFGTKFTYDILEKEGKSSIIFNWLMHQKSLSKMLDDGNGTLYEHLYHENESKNHAMFGSYGEWAFKNIGMIDVRYTKNDMRQLIINLDDFRKYQDLDWANARYKDIHSSWKLEKKRFSSEISMASSDTEILIVVHNDDALNHLNISSKIIEEKRLDNKRYLSIEKTREIKIELDWR